MNAFVLGHSHIRSNTAVLINFIAISKGGITQFFNFKLKYENWSIPLCKSCNKSINYLPASLFWTFLGLESNALLGGGHSVFWYLAFLWLLIQYMYSKKLTGWIMCFMLWIFQVCALLWCKHYKELISSHGFALNQLTIWKYPTMTKVSELSGNLLINNLQIQCNLWILRLTVSNYVHRN